MKISELIDILNRFKDRHGDLNVYVIDGSEPQPIVITDHTQNKGIVVEL